MQEHVYCGWFVILPTLGETYATHNHLCHTNDVSSQSIYNNCSYFEPFKSRTFQEWNLLEQGNLYIQTNANIIYNINVHLAFHTNATEFFPKHVLDPITLQSS